MPVTGVGETAVGTRSRRVRYGTGPDRQMVPSAVVTTASVGWHRCETGDKRPDEWPKKDIQLSRSRLQGTVQPQDNDTDKGSKLGRLPSSFGTNAGRGQVMAGRGCEQPIRPKKKN